MIQKLMQEATEEAEHKGFCDTELTTNKQTRDAMTAKATAIREAEKEKNKATIEDAKGAQAAVQQALAVLQEFYDKAAVQGAAMTQEQEKAEPTGSINYDERALQILDKTSLLQKSSATQRPAMRRAGTPAWGT